MSDFGQIQALTEERDALRKAHSSLIGMFHDAVQAAGWHPGRTDDNLCGIIRAKGKELAALRERVEALERDAARYRWLRDKASVMTPHIYTPDGWRHYRQGADDVIDAAMKES